MSDIFSWIDESAESGRAVDYQDHLAAMAAADSEHRRTLRQSNEIWLMWQRSAMEARSMVRELVAYYDANGGPLPSVTRAKMQIAKWDAGQ